MFARTQRSALLGCGFAAGHDLRRATSWRRCATWAIAPYTEKDFTTWPSYAAFSNAIPFRAQSYTLLGDGLTPDITNAMKARLAGGDLCVMSFPLWRPYFDSPGRFDLLTNTD